MHNYNLADIIEAALIKAQNDIAAEREAHQEATRVRGFDEAAELISKYKKWFGNQKGKRRDKAYIRVLQSVHKYLDNGNWKVRDVFSLQLFVNGEIYDNQNIPIAEEVYRYYASCTSQGWVVGNFGSMDYATLTLEP